MDRINANVFRQIKEKKHGTADKKNDIFAKPKPKNPDKKYTRPTGQYTLNQPVPQQKQALPSSSAKGNNALVPKQQQLNEIPDDVDLYYANPNNYTPDFKTKVSVNKQGVITRTNGSGVTTLQALVRNPKNPNQPEAYQYKVRTKHVEDPDLDIDMQQMSLKQQKMSAQDKQVAKMQAQVLVNTVKQNRLTLGTQSMMDNERLHAQEAIESGVYVTWSTQSKMGKTVDCFRVGSNSVCICGHGYPDHDCILTKKKFSTKCHNCKCKAFQYIPQFPEEIGEYWVPYQKGFNYQTWKAKCKCKHGWNEHNGDGYFNCKKCGCGGFNSAFCCAVCNKFWQDHEMIYELENERIANGKPVREDYIPFNEMPEMYDALYQ